MQFTEREGTYFRVCEAGWDDPADTTFSKATGGRWNPAGEFGALYLNRTIEVARANAKRLYAGSFYQPEDLTGEAELQLLEFEVPASNAADCVSAEGLTACGLPVNYPYGFDRDHTQSQAVARGAYNDGGDGVAARSAAQCTESTFLGEELALFDRAAGKATKGKRYGFTEWYQSATE